MNGSKKDFLPIKPIRRTSVPDEIIHHLKELIDSQYLTPGSRLPGERELAKMLDVSRPSLREALRVLSRLGIVENRPGSGTYLADSAAPWPLEPFSLLFSLNKSALFEVFEARKGLEGMVASLAAQRRTEGDLKTMREALEGMGKNLKDYVLYTEYEKAFHLAIVEAARNNVISDLMNKLYWLLEETRERFYRDAKVPPNLRDIDYRNHQLIYQRIEAGDEHEASVVMISHLLDFERQLKALERQENNPKGGYLEQ
jgi:GntR family transcriptional repressor for pyruvate dehydrogenase complex